MEELLEQFLAESRDLVASVAADFGTLSVNPQDSAAIESAFRAMHTLKGSFGVFAFAPAERALHVAEDQLERARSGALALDAEVLDALIATLDEVERWLDSIERTGGLGADADDTADRLCERLAPGTTGQSGAATSPVPASTSWLASLTAREAPVIAGASGPLTAFRYTPDPGCFFRGDDPLAVVAQVPDLLSLTILPADGTWPEVEGLEPFNCFSILEGLSAAPLETVRGAFRLMPDQVALTVVSPSAAGGSGLNAGGEVPTSRTVRVEAGRLTELAHGLGELLIAAHGVARLADAAEAVAPALGAQIRAMQGDLSRIGNNLHRSLSAIRSAPLGSTLRRMPRLAREIAGSVGKQIDFALSGEGVEADRQIAEGLFEPLLHLLRNAIDHGIEPAESRLAAGKPERGRIALALRRDGDMIDVTLDDDGAGMDPDLIRAVAVRRGLVTAAEAAALPDAAALRLIFLAGFSTADAVTELSGRGVGMNAVQVAIAALRGTVDVESRQGLGTRFRMRLPANALITRLLVIEAGGQRYGVSLDQVMELINLREDQLLPLGYGRACVLHRRTVPVLDLAALLGAQPASGDTAPLLVTRAGNEMVALRVDSFGERIDAPIQPLGGVLAAVPGIMGSAVHSDGGVLLVLDLPEIAA